MVDKTTRRAFLSSVTAAGLSAGIGLTAGELSAKDAPVRPSILSPAGDSYILPRKVLLYECTRREIRERLISGKLKAAIVPTGSTEQHNEHMAMIMDTAGALLISQQIALRMYPEVVVSTPVSVGISPHWMNRKGTLTLKKETFLAMVYDICESLKTHGIETILIVNGHGGNEEALKESIPEFRSKLGITIDAYSYWDGISKDLAKQFLETGNSPGYAPEFETSHASEFETSIALAAFPERIRYVGVDHNKAELTITDEERKVDKSGFEQSKLATAEKGEAIISYAVNCVVEKLRVMMG